MTYKIYAIEETIKTTDKGTKTKSTKIAYYQEVGWVDMVKVISAINNIEIKMEVDTKTAINNLAALQRACEYTNHKGELDAEETKQNAEENR